MSGKADQSLENRLLKATQDRRNMQVGEPGEILAQWGAFPGRDWDDTK